MHFSELEVYTLAERMADSIWTLVTRWDDLAQNTIGKQIVRAADSVGANIAEGSGRGTYADNRRFVRNARGSLYETQHWLRRAHRRGLLRPEEVARLKPMLMELKPRLNAYLRSIGRNARDVGRAAPPVPGSSNLAPRDE